MEKEREEKRGQAPQEDLSLQPLDYQASALPLRNGSCPSTAQDAYELEKELSFRISLKNDVVVEVLVPLGQMLQTLQFRQADAEKMTRFEVWPRLRIIDKTKHFSRPN